MAPPRLILASQSTSRRAMLSAAGVEFEAMAAGVDEEAMKEGLRAEGISPRNLADALAEFKATRLSQRFPTRWCSAATPRSRSTTMR